MARQRTDKTGESVPARLCAYDGGELDHLGLCPVGNGYPEYLPCPFVCPRCMTRLTWSGTCQSCHGSATPDDRATWRCPGDRYDLYDDDGKPIGDGTHWTLTVKGPIPVATKAQALAAIAEIKRILRDAPLVRGVV